MGDERDNRRIGSKPDSKTPIGDAAKREATHPWAKGNTHPTKQQDS